MQDALSTNKKGVPKQGAEHLDLDKLFVTLM